MAKDVYQSQTMELQSSSLQTQVAHVTHHKNGETGISMPQHKNISEEQRLKVPEIIYLEQSLLCHWVTAQKSKTSRSPTRPDHGVYIPHTCSRHEGSLLDPLRRFKGMLSWLFLHEIDLILDGESLDVAYAIEELTPKIKQSVQGYIGRRINRALYKWVDSPLEFRTVLRRTQSIVTGSLALQVILGVEWHDQNMDIYVPYGPAKYIVLDFLQRIESYNIVFDWNNDPKARFNEPYIMSVTQLQRTTRTIQGYVVRYIHVLQSNAGSTRPVALGGATWSMNWIGADEIIVGYPELTLAREGVLNDTIQEFALEEDGKFSPWLNKYGDRGFTLVEGTNRPDPDWERRCSIICTGRRYQEEGEDVMRLITRTYDQDLSPEKLWLANHWRSLSDFNFECLSHYVEDYAEFEDSDGFGGTIVGVSPRTWDESYERYSGCE